MENGSKEPGKWHGSQDCPVVNRRIWVSKTYGYLLSGTYNKVVAFWVYIWFTYLGNYQVLN